MDKRMEEILNMYENSALDLDDSFQFKCRECGKCCKNREDIMLTTRDLYNIARDLGRTMEKIVRRYCEVYIGKDSHVPIIRLRPVGPDKMCPLLHNKKCIVHKVKPSVCALFPLGRVAAFRKSDGEDKTFEDVKPKYFVWSVTCGTKDQTQTVREWLERFGLPIEDEFYGPWNDTVTFLSIFFHEIEEKKPPQQAMEFLWNAAIQMLYIDYDPKEALLSQFHENSTKIRGLFHAIKEESERVFGGPLQCLALGPVRVESAAAKPVIASNVTTMAELRRKLGALIS